MTRALSRASVPEAYIFASFSSITSETRQVLSYVL